MKKIWTTPLVSAETFEANEYVATCYAMIGKNTVITKYYPTDGKCDSDSTANAGKHCDNKWNGTGFEDDGFDLLAGLEDIYNGKNSGWYYSPSLGSKTGHAYDLGGPYAGTAGNYGNGAFHGWRKGSQHMAEDAYFIKIETITSSNHTQFNCGPNAS